MPHVFAVGDTMNNALPGEVVIWLDQEVLDWLRTRAEKDRVRTEQLMDRDERDRPELVDLILIANEAHSIICQAYDQENPPEYPDPDPEDFDDVPF